MLILKRIRVSEEDVNIPQLMRCAPEITMVGDIGIYASSIRLSIKKVHKKVHLMPNSVLWANLMDHAKQQA